MKHHNKFSLKTVVLLADQLLQILESIHNKSVLHRDLKPENILIGKDKEESRVYLVDYGISKVYRDKKGNHS